MHIRKIIRHGNSIAVTVPRGIGLELGDFVTLKLDEQGLVIRKLEIDKA